MIENITRSVPNNLRVNIDLSKIKPKKRKYTKRYRIADSTSDEEEDQQAQRRRIDPTINKFKKYIIVMPEENLINQKIEWH